MNERNESKYRYPLSQMDEMPDFNVNIFVYNPKTKKGKIQPQFLYNADPNGANNRGSAIADVINDSPIGKRNLDYLGSPEKYAEYDVTISPVDASLDKELAEAQGAFSKFKNAMI